MPPRSTWRRRDVLRGAELAGNEVHVGLSLAGESERRLLACDLRAGQFGSLASERVAASA